MSLEKIINKTKKSLKGLAYSAIIGVALMGGIKSRAVTPYQTKYGGGVGEPNNPYRIATPNDLNDIGNHEEDWDKHFILVNDVNLAEYPGTQFKIIGRYIKWNDTNNKPFIGIFDGNAKRIWNFTWSSTGRNGIGLFGYIGKDGRIKNLGMENVDVKDETGLCIGGLVGKNSGKIITCYSTGSISGSWDVGGIVGINYNGSIIHCSSKGSISGTGNVGRVVGYNCGMMTNCYSAGYVEGHDVVGGLVGYNCGVITNCYSRGGASGYYADVGGLVGFNDYGTITNCYSRDSVSGTVNIGGLVGLNQSGVITYCYSTGSISGAGEYVGGLVGGNQDEDLISVVSYSFWDTQTSGQLTSAGGTPKTTAEMKTIDTFVDAGWDFVDVWGIGEHQTYPYLKFAPAGDLNYDKKVNFVDLSILASHWLEGVE